MSATMTAPTSVDLRARLRAGQRPRLAAQAAVAEPVRSSEPAAIDLRARVRGSRSACPSADLVQAERERMAHLPAPLPAAKFELGEITVSRAAQRLIAKQGIELETLLRRHAGGDYGEALRLFGAMNDAALERGTLIRSFYGEKKTTRLLIETAAVSQMCPACHHGLGECEPERGVIVNGQHWRYDLPARRLTTAVRTAAEA